MKLGGGTTSLPLGDAQKAGWELGITALPAAGVSLASALSTIGEERAGGLDSSTTSPPFSAGLVSKEVLWKENLVTSHSSKTTP